MRAEQRSPPRRAAYSRQASGEMRPVGRRRPAHTRSSDHADTGANGSLVSLGNRSAACFTLRLAPRGADRDRYGPLPASGAPAVGKIIPWIFRYPWYVCAENGTR